MKQERLEQARTACTQIFGSTSKTTMDIFVRTVQWADENPDTPTCNVANCPNRNGELVRADNSKVIANLQGEIKTLQAKLAGYEKADAILAKMQAENEGNKTIFCNKHDNVSVLFGDGHVLIAPAEGNMKDGTYLCGVDLFAIKESKPIGETVGEKKTTDELVAEGILYAPNVSLMFKKAESVYVLIKYLDDVREQLLRMSEKKGV